MGQRKTCTLITTCAIIEKKKNRPIKSLQIPERNGNFSGGDRLFLARRLENL
jgi:hypothetical protein